MELVESSISGMLLGLKYSVQCVMVIVEAKVQFSVGLAIPQLLVYLACLCQSRLERNRTNYGVSTDGYQFTGIFVTITHDGLSR